MATLLSHYVHKYEADQNEDLYVGLHSLLVDPMKSMINDHCDRQINDLFANTTANEDEEEIYPVTVSEIADAQQSDRKLKKLFKRGIASKDNISLKVIDDVDVLVYKNSRLVVPAALTEKVVMWYHHYLQHPGHTRLEHTIAATMYWKSLRSDVRRQR